MGDCSNSPVGARCWKLYVATLYKFHLHVSGAARIPSISTWLYNQYQPSPKKNIHVQGLLVFRINIDHSYSSATLHVVYIFSLSIASWIKRFLHLPKRSLSPGRNLFFHGLCGLTIIYIILIHFSCHTMHTSLMVIRHMWMKYFNWLLNN